MYEHIVGQLSTHGVLCVQTVQSGADGRMAIFHLKEGAQVLDLVCMYLHIPVLCDIGERHM